jgi:ribonuclease BN (tRNA processing enzyme)
LAEIIIIGSSSGDPSPDRGNASLMLKIGGQFYQFDAGEGVASSIKRLKISQQKITSIFITHMHPDHITGLLMEIQLMHLAKRIEPLLIYVPSEAKDAIEIFLNATYLFKANLGFELVIKAIQPDPLFRDSNIAIYARENSHLQKYKNTIEDGHHPNKMQSYSFVIKTGNRKIIYSGDVGGLEDYADLVPGCDLVISEGMHIDFEGLFKTVIRSGVKNLILTHLSAEMYQNQKSLLELADKIGVKNFYVAKDGFSLKL